MLGHFMIMNFKKSARKQVGPNCRYCFGICMQSWRKPTENLGEVSWLQGCDWNLRHSRYEGSTDHSGTKSVHKVQQNPNYGFLDIRFSHILGFVCVSGFIDVLKSYHNDYHLRTDESTYLSRLNYYVITAQTVTNTHKIYSVMN